MWIDPIFDRTLADVEYAAKNRGSPEPLKGARNYTDLQRITGNIHFVAELIAEFGYAPPPLLCKTEWSMNEIPRRSDIDKIRQDLAELRAAFVNLRDAPPTPDLPYLGYQKLNDIERILFDIKNAADRISLAWFTCGEIISGEV